MQYYSDYGDYWDRDMAMPMSTMPLQIPAVPVKPVQIQDIPMPDMNLNMPTTPPYMMTQYPGMMQQGVMPQSLSTTAPQDPYTYPRNLPEALMLIRNAVAGEREDELFYDYLIGEAPSSEDKQIITSIRDDERKHNRMFREIYYEITCQMLPQGTDTDFERPGSYLAGIQRALFGELGAVERYRRILFAMQNRKHINMVTEILTDELKHASKYNFIYAKNRN